MKKIISSIFFVKQLFISHEKYLRTSPILSSQQDNTLVTENVRRQIATYLQMHFHSSLCETPIFAVGCRVHGKWDAMRIA